MLNIDALINSHWERIVDLRRKIHENPELSTQEKNTQELVISILNELGIQVKKSTVGYGVTGLLEGGKEGPTILLRADMDALPIEEKTGLGFSSKVPGVMHACGHDIHTATLLGTAMVLNEIKAEIPGRVKFCFQPAEENNPLGGARDMIKEGVLENPKVDAAYAMHVWNGLEVGQVSLKEGPMMSRSDRFKITVKGKSAHASAPHEGIDAIYIASQVVNSLQSVISRRIDPQESVVITIGSIIGEGRYNILCKEVELEGTLRLFNESIRDNVIKEIRRILRGIEISTGSEINFVDTPGYPVTENDSELTKRAIERLRDSLGDENIIIAKRPKSAGEDFGFYAKEVPSVFLWAGIDSPDNEGKRVLHSPNFCPDEGVMKVGIKSFVSFIL